MSSCEKYQEMISRMLDGDLDAREEADLARHIKECAECAALFQAFSLLSRRVGEQLEEAPRDLRETVMAGVRREEIRKRNRLPMAVRGVLSVAACLAVIVGVYWGVSLSKGNQMSAAVLGAAPAAAMGQEEKAEAAPEEAGEEQVFALQNAPAAPAAAPAAEPAPSLRSASEEDAVSADAAPAAFGTEDDGAPAEKNDGLDEEEPEAPQVPDRELPNWDLSLLRELLGGEETELRPEELEDALVARILVKSGESVCSVPLYQRDGQLYYYDPVRDAVYLAELSPEELNAFLG